MSQSRLGQLRVILIFAVAFSMLSLTATLTASPRLPIIPSVWAVPAPCPTHGSTGVCSEYWIPAGAAMDTFQAQILGANCEYIALGGGVCGCPSCHSVPPSIDSPDIPAPSNMVSFFNSSSSYYLTAPISGSQFPYLINWQRVVNGPQTGIPNFFTWLDMQSSSPSIPGTIRQGFAQPTVSVSPYVASTASDFYIVGNIYDSLETLNPLNSGQLMDWMVISSSQTPVSNSQLNYVPPAGTVATYRFILRSDIFFQDGNRLTAFDVAFSYLSLKASGAVQAQGAASMTGVTILSPFQFDINVNSTTFSTKTSLTSLTILPGRYWTSGGASAWTSGILACTITAAPCYPAQYTLGPSPSTGTAQAICSLTCLFPASSMNADPAKTSVSYDPVVNHNLVGSGPWSCGVVTSAGSGVCTSSGNMNPPTGGTYSLTRFGSGSLPGSTVSGDYFRSSANLAEWIWSGDDGDVTHDFLNFAMVGRCFGVIVGANNGCTKFQQGIGTNGVQPIPVGLTQVSIVLRFFGVNWVSPFDWRTNPPTGIVPLTPNPPILYAGPVTLNPASAIGCPGGYDC